MGAEDNLKYLYTRDFPNKNRAYARLLYNFQNKKTDVISLQLF